MPGDYQRIERAIHYLDAQLDQQPGLGDLAAHLGLSPFHLQRLFKRWAGISPKLFVKCLTQLRARSFLHQGQSVLDASIDAGLSSPGRLHDLCVSIDAATPGEIKSGGAGIGIRWGIHPTPFGDAIIGVTRRGVCALHFVTEGEAPLSLISATWPGAALVEDRKETAAVMRRIFAPANGAPASVAILAKGSNFQIQVWQALLSIPAGAVRTYGGIARDIGSPKAARAVGSAIARNNIACLIPCHRAILSTGTIHRYRWGPVRKRAILLREMSLEESPLLP